MSQRSVEDLPCPANQYRIDLPSLQPCGSPGFETVARAIEIDHSRAVNLSRALQRGDGDFYPREAKQLADRLAISGLQNKVPITPASALYMRQVRIRVCGALWPLVLEDNATTFTVVAPAWSIPANWLLRLNPQQLKNQFRADLERAGFKESGGWIFAGFHCEHEPVSNTFVPHFHGLCSRSAIPVLDRLRQQQKYRFAATLPEGVPPMVHRPVMVRRQPLYGMPYPLTYVLQSYWPSRPVYMDENGQRRRVRDKRAIREPYGSMAIHWLDISTLKNLTLLMGLRVTRQGLVRTR